MKNNDEKSGHINPAFDSLVETKNQVKTQFDRKADFKYREGGWGWVVVIASAYSFGILYGMVGNYALIFNKFEEVYNGTENHVFYAAWIGSVSNGVQFILCLVGSFLVSYFNARLIGIIGGLISTVSLIASALVTYMPLYFITHGLILSTGQALLLASSLSILPHYFNKKLSLANGIATCLCAVIIVLLPTATSIILDRIGLQAAFYFLAALNFISALACLTYRPMLPSMHNESIRDRVREAFGVKVLKNPKFMVWCVATFIGMFGYLIPIVNIDHHSIHAFPGHNPVYINILFSSSAGLSGIIFGKIGDYTTFNRVHYHTFAFAIYGLVTLTIPFAPTFTVFVIQLIILGLIDGIWLCFKVPIACDLIGNTSLVNSAIGYYHAVMAPMSIAGPAVAGKLFEINKNYDLAFFLAGASCLTSAAIITLFIGLPGCFKKPK